MTPDARQATWDELARLAQGFNDAGMDDADAVLAAVRAHYAQSSVAAVEDAVDSWLRDQRTRMNPQRPAGARRRGDLAG